MTHGEGVYFIGTPIFKKAVVRHPMGQLTILAPNVSRENCYIQSVWVNGVSCSKNWLTHKQLFTGDVTLEFEMGPEPNESWGSAPDDCPLSMCDRLKRE